MIRAAHNPSRTVSADQDGLGHQGVHVSGSKLRDSNSPTELNPELWFDSHFASRNPRLPAFLNEAW